MLAKIRPYTLSRQQVNFELQKLKKRWHESALEKRTVAVAKELAGLQAQEDELWEAWERSKKESQTTAVESFTTKAKGKANSKKVSKSRVTTEQQVGDAQFQKLIADIRVQRRQLLGLDAPAKIQEVGEDWTPQEFVIGVTESELPRTKQK